MNVLSLLEKEKHVAGIEIDESIIRVLLFRNKKPDGFLSFHESSSPLSSYELVTFEETIPEGLIVEGRVIDPQNLGRVLQAIFSKNKISTRYAILAIPDDKIYSRIFTFPKALDKERINEAMGLATTFQLPFDQDTIYSDWEIIGTTDQTTEVLFSAISKEVTEGFVTAFTIAGIKPLALESHFDSIARAIATTPGTPTLYTKQSESGASIFITQDGYTRFSRTLPSRHISKNKLKEEAEKVKTAFEASYEGAQQLPIKSLDTVTIKDEYLSFKKLSEDQVRFIVPLGAAIRGLLPDGMDNLISLLPIKTEQAYLYQKAVTFIVLLRNVTIGISIFFALSFVAMYFTMLSLSQTANRSIASLSATPISPEMLANEATVKRVNELTTTAKMILSETPLWSLLLEELSLRTIAGITVTSFSASSLTGEMSIAGSAADRATLNQFKKTLQESLLLKDVVLPITNLEQKENIAFSMTFKLRDPAALYYK